MAFFTILLTNIIIAAIIHIICINATIVIIYTLSLHDALPICRVGGGVRGAGRPVLRLDRAALPHRRSEEHTSELQSHVNLVCRLLLEKKKVYACVCSTWLLRLFILTLMILASTKLPACRRATV